MVRCDYCDKNEAVFTMEVEWIDGVKEHSDRVCSGCFIYWFTETPEDIKEMFIKKK